MTSPVNRAAVDALTKRIKGLEQRLDRLARTPQLKRSSIDDGALTVKTDGQVTAVIGQQSDGTSGVVVVDGPVPPVPTAPVMETVTGGVRLTWHGDFAQSTADRIAGVDTVAPLDFKQVEIEVSDSPDFTDGTGTRTGLFIHTVAGGYQFAPWTPGTLLYARARTWSLAGKSSAWSLISGPTTSGKIGVGDLGFDISTLSGTHVFYGTTDPTTVTGQTVTFGDLWLKQVDAGPPPQYETWRWTPAEGADPDRWVMLADQAATGALEAAITAQIAADSKAKLFTQPTTPAWSGAAGTAYWVDTAHGNRPMIWNGTTWVAYTLGNGAITPNSLVASDVVVTGSVSASLLEAILVLVTAIVAGDPTGTHATMKPDGLHVYDENANEVIRLGTTTNDYFGIVDALGNLLASIDDSGSVNAQTANFLGDITIRGQRLLDSVITAIPGGGGGGTAAPGARNWTGWAPDSIINSVTTEVGLVEVAYTVEAGRLYDVIPALYYQCSNANTFCTVTVRDGGTSSPTITSPIVTQDFFPCSSAHPEWTLLAQASRPWVFTTGGVHRLLVTVAAGGGGSLNVVNTGNGRVPTLDVNDRGIFYGNPGSTNRGGGGISPPPPPTNPTQTHDTGWLPPHAWFSYRGSGVARTDTTDVVQGWDPSGFNGDGSGFWWWDLPTITGTVKEVWVWLQSNSTFYNSGGTGIVAPIKTGTTYPVTSWQVASAIPYGTFTKPGTLQMNLSGWNPLFHSSQGANRAIGISVGPSGGTNETYYIRFDGPSARMRIVYEQ